MIALVALTLICAPAEFVDAYDGDTVTLRIDLGLGVSKTERVRLCDIDTPEIRGGGAEALDAKHALVGFLTTAEKIEVVPSGGIYTPRRSFNRLLAWVRVDGHDVGEMLLKAGLAKLAEKRCLKW